MITQDERSRLNLGSTSWEIPLARASSEKSNLGGNKKEGFRCANSARMIQTVLVPLT